MPDVVVHASFGNEVLGALEPAVREKMVPEIYTFGLFGPDVWFLYQPWKRQEGRGRRMHTTRTGDFLAALASQGKESARPEEIFSYLSGFLCHYALDSTTHPYIIYRTTEEFHYKRCHTAFEHSLDRCQLTRDGVWGERHPITEYYLPALQLPQSMASVLNAVYQEIYGWKNTLPALNLCYARFRRVYRNMENPRGIGARLARLTRSGVIRGYVYSESPFADVDVENLAHAPWHHSHDESLISTESFPELRAWAATQAREWIAASYDSLWTGRLRLEELKKLIGNNSYLSGLPMGDPRNLKVKSLLPPSSP